MNMIKMKPLLKESTWKDRKFGEPLPTIEDYMKEKGDVGRGVDPDATDANIDKDLMDKQIVYRDKDTGEDKTISVRGALKQGEDHPAYDDAKKMVDKEKGGNDKEEPAGKLGGGDFERDFDDGEPEDKPFGGDTGTDADFGMDDEPESGDDVDKLIKQTSSKGISDDEWDKVSPKVKKEFRSKVTKIYSTMKKLSDNEEYDKLEKMEKKFGMQLWQAKGLYDDFVEMGEITIDGKKYKPITENIEPTIFNPQEEIKKEWDKIKTRQFDRKWKK